MQSTDKERGERRLITEREVESEFSIPVRTLQKWRYAGGGPPFAKLGRSVRYRPADIETFIEAHLMTSTSQYALAERNN